MSLSQKLTLTFVLTSLLGIGLVAFFAWQSATQQITNFVDTQNKEVLLTRLQDHYERRGSWDDINQSRIPGLGRDNNRPRFTLADANNRVLVAQFGRAGRQLNTTELATGIPIMLDGQQVGTLITTNEELRLAIPPPTGFLRQVNQAVSFAAIGGTAVSILLAFALTRTLTKPLATLTHATQNLAQGELGYTVPVTTNDEIGQLTKAFNQMSQDLAEGQRLRRQLTADIAHDLRTPISVILTHAEALNDGILPATSETFDVIQDEAQRLQRLVEDLRLLTLSAAGELRLTTRLLPPRALLEHALIAHTPLAQQKQVNLTLGTVEDLPDLNLDRERFMQVLDNLISNAIRHTPANGTVTLEASKTSQAVQLRVHDTGIGIPADQLPHIFDRFYRTDKSRNRQDGGSGLGLAIAKSIIEQHKGTITVESTLNVGTTFTITLPQTG